MKVLKWILAIVLTLIAVILVWALMLPAKVTISAETTIDQPYQMVFHSAASFNDRVKWDPWLETEPTAKSKFEFKEGYIGSIYQWQGETLGSGKMQVDSIKYGQYIASSLFFGEVEKPNLVEWFFKKEDKSTHVKWSFTADAGYPFERIMFKLFISSMMKQSFDKGLANFKKLLESKPSKISRLTDIEIKDVAAMQAMAITKDGNIQDMEKIMKAMYTELHQVVMKQKLKINGMPFSKYTNYNPSTGDVTVTTGLVVEKLGKKYGDVKPVKIPAFTMIQGIHHGPYQELPLSYQTLMEEANDKRKELTGTAWEFNITTPGQVQEIAFMKTILGFEIKK
ncbi:hypothetical protein EMN47_09475 [Prolixibacteraceae bacterium JC049]|nr:hypothetical protein [Prolixibacteraceae bacterium JC049]